MKGTVMKKKILAVSAVVFITQLWTQSTLAIPQDWQKIKRPISGEPMPIGTYNNGCIIGAVPLPFNGEGYQVIRTSKNRYYGHPDMIAYLQRLGKKVKKKG